MDVQTSNPYKAVIFLTNRVGRLLTQAIWQKVDQEEVEIQPQHMGVLSDLWEKDGIRQQDLAISNIKDKATIARTISLLEKKNILVRVEDPNDKRTKRIYLTHKGKNLKQHLIPHAHATVEEATENISEEELNTCNEVLSKIYNNLNSCMRND